MPSALGSDRTQPAFDRLAGLLRRRSGFAITPDKSYLLESRLSPLLDRHGLRDLGALAARLDAADAGDLATAVVDAMTINETFFFRDVRPFAHLGDVVLPALHAARPGGRPLRVWSAASSTGQEAWSVAMLAAERRDRLDGRVVEILGTDIAAAPVARARAGVYTRFEAERGLPPSLRSRYLEPLGDAWRIAPSLRGAVRFDRFNLLDDPGPFGVFDVILCRNVLIYFDLPTKTAVLDRLARRLAPDGVLYLGGAETVLGITGSFERRADEPCCRPVLPMPTGTNDVRLSGRW